jgi:hypothetical protein
VRNDGPLISGVVGLQHRSVGVGGEDGHRAAVHQHLQLFFRRAPGLTFRFDLLQMPQGGLPAADHFVDEQPHAQEGREDQDVARDPGTGAPLERIEQFGKQRAHGGGNADLPALQNAADHEHWKQVEEPERDVAVGAPIGYGDQRDQHSGLDEHGFGATAKKK